MALLFFIANRGAYEGFFQGDELDSLGWTPQVPVAVFAKDLVNPVYNARNFRPVGHFYFRIMSRAFGLDFRHYLLPLHPSICSMFGCTCSIQCGCYRP
jgi:hypothetical protein